MVDIELFKAGTFSPEAVDLLERAYERALSLLSGETVSPENKETIAKHLVSIARGGEANEDRLASLAVLRVLGRTQEATRSTSAP